MAVAGAAFAQPLPEPERWVLVPASTPFLRAPDLPTDGGSAGQIDVQPVVKALAEAGFAQDGLVPLLFVADAGERLEVQTPGEQMADGLFCVPLAWDWEPERRHLVQFYRLRGYIPRSAPLPVFRERVHFTFADGSEATFEPGLPAQAEALPDGGLLFRFEAPFAVKAPGFGCAEPRERAYRDFAMPMRAGVLGLDFELPSTHLHLPEEGPWELNAEEGRVGSKVIIPLGSEGPLPDTDVTLRGSTALVQLHDRCDTLRVIVPRRALRKDPRHLSGVFGGCMGGHSDRYAPFPPRPNRWLVSKGVPVFWPTGETAGRTTNEDAFQTDPEARGRAVCFDEKRGLLPTRPMCFDPSDVLKVGDAPVGGRQVPRCNGARPAPKESKELELPAWAAMPRDVALDCDIASSGRPECCDYPQMEDREEAQLRLALDLKRVHPPGPPGRPVRMHLVLTSHGDWPTDAGTRMP